MASSNDRKISQLPVQSAIADDTNFLVVSGISTTPRNERINTGVLFNEIPVKLVVGQELNGRDVVFNSTTSSTNRFYFEGLTGDVTLGHDLTVSNDVNITGDLNVTGIATFNNPVLVNLDLPGNLNVNGTVAFKSTLTTDGAASLESLNVANNSVLNGNLNVSGQSTFTANTTHTNIIANYAHVINSDLTNIISSSIDTTDLTVSNDLNIAGNVIANGYMQAIGNMFADVGDFQQLQVDGNGQVDGTLTANNVTVMTNLNTPTFTTTTITSQDINITNNATVENLTANVSTLTTSTIGLLQGTDVFLANTLTSVNADITNITSTVGNISTINSNIITATDVYSSNSLQGNTISTKATTDSLKFKVYTIEPSHTLFEEGEFILYYNGTTYRLQMATSTGWVGEFLS